MSNLAVHYIPIHDRQGDWDLIADKSRKLTKLVYSGMPDTNHVRRAFDSMDPDGILILRNHPLSEQKDDVVRSPAITGKRHADEWMSWHRSQAPFLPKSRIQFEGVNEFPIWEKGNAPLNIYYCEFMDHLGHDGYRANAGQFNVGWPANSGEDTPSNWAPFRGILKRLSWDGHWLGLHEYFGLVGPDALMAGWWAYRYRHCIDYCQAQGFGFPPIVIAELGICREWQDQNGGWHLDPHDGWIGNTSAESAYGHLLRYAEVSQSDGIIAGTVFTTDGAHPWFNSMDTERFHDQWRAGPPQSLGTGPIELPPSKPPSKPPVTEVIERSLSWPLKQVRITQKFGANYSTYFNAFGSPGHNGLDFAAPLGTDILAAADGTVGWAGWDDAYGWYLRIYHPHLRLHTFYAHMVQSSGLSIGDKIYRGQKLGSVGSTGNSTGPHLHYEIRLADHTGNYIESPHSGMGKGRIDPLAWMETQERILTPGTVLEAVVNLPLAG